MKKSILKKGSAMVLTFAFAMCTLAGCGTEKASDTESKKVVEAEGEDGLEGALGGVPKKYEGVLGYGYDVIYSDCYNEDDIDTSAEVLNTDALLTQKLLRVRDMTKSESELRLVDSWNEMYQMNAKIYNISGNIKDQDVEIAFLGMQGASRIGDLWKRGQMVEVRTNIYTAREYIDVKSLEQLKGCVTKEFESDVAKLSGKELLDKYKDAVLTDVRRGGVFRMLHSFDEEGLASQQEALKQLGIYLEDNGLGEGYTSSIATSSGGKVSVTSAGSAVSSSAASADANAYGKEYYKEVSKSGFLRIHTLGGDSSIRRDNINSAMKYYPDWEQSVYDGADTFITAPGIIPVWKFVELFDVNKATEVKNAFIAKYEEAKKKAEQ